MVEADHRYPGHRAALGARRRDAAGHARGAAGSRITRSGICCRRSPRRRILRRGRRSADRTRGRRHPDGMGGRQAIRHLSPQHRQAAAAGRRRSGGTFTLTRWAKQITDHVELAVYLYPKGEVPKYRTYLTMFNAASSQAGSPLDIPPNTVARDRRFPRFEAGRPAREFPAAHASARQGDAAGSDPARRVRSRPSATSTISTSTG